MDLEQTAIFNNIIREVTESMDHTLDFHNASHVIKVYKATVEILSSMNFLTDNEKHVLSFIALMHDICHPGITNTQHALWNTNIHKSYGHNSSNEQMHADMACMLFRKYNILNAFPCSIEEKTIRSIILSTDIVEHFNVMKNIEKSATRENLYMTIIKCADIFHITNDFKECIYWGENINKEMGTIMNIEHEIRFIQKMGKPLFERLYEMYPCEQFEKYINAIQQNVTLYEQMRSVAF